MITHMVENVLVLSLFPGIGLFDLAFEEQGFCVVRGPDVLWGGDVRRFHPPAGRFEGVIGGPPCQGFSTASQLTPGWKGENLIPEFERCVFEAQPTWFVMENVRHAPLPAVVGYVVEDVLVNNRCFGERQNRVRRFSFGTRDGRRLAIDGVTLFEHPEFARCAMASEGSTGYCNHKGYSPRRPWPEFCELQGLPPDYLDKSPFTLTAKYRVVGNGVPLPMGRAIARAVEKAVAEGNGRGQPGQRTG